MIIKITDPSRLQEIQTIWEDNLRKAGISQRSSNGLYALDIREETSEGGTEYFLLFKEYGLFLDAGVRGAKGGQATSSPFRMKSKGIFKALSGKFDTRTIGAIYWYGLKPRPFIQEFLTKIEGFMTQDIEQSITRDIEASIDALPQVDINKTI